MNNIRIAKGEKFSQFILFAVILAMALSLSGCFHSDSNDSTPTVQNLPPIADAGVDLTAEEQESVTLVGSGTDSDGTVISYAWLQISGSLVSLNDASNATATFFAPMVKSSADLVFQLTVTDDQGATVSDTLTVNVLSIYDGVNGGRLFDKFWAQDPTGTGFSLNNSNLSTQDQLDGITSNGDFFRCKQCHGWDRLGREGAYSNRAPNTGRPNVADLDLTSVATRYSEQELFAAIKADSANRRDIDTDLSTYDPAENSIVGDQMPNFSQILTDEQVWDLVKFFALEAVDSSQIYDLTLGAGTYPDRDRTFSNLGKDGDATNGDILFASTCKLCHGADGTAFMFDDGKYSVGRHVRAKPYEDILKVKFGHPGSIMEPQLTDNNDIKDLFKALANADNYPDVPPALPGEGINGGRLYDKFWASDPTGTGFTLANSNLNSQAELNNIMAFGNFFRCKQCHGWDRLGREGGYSDRAPKTSRPNVADLDLAALVESYDLQQLFAAIKTGTATRRDIATDLSTYDPNGDTTVGDQMPNFSQIFTDGQIWQLVRFLKEEAIDTTQLYDINLDDGFYPNRGRTFSNIGKDGNQANGDAIFAQNCSGCHGVDGTAILVDGGEFTVGAHLRSKPYEDQHKVKFGNPGTIMGAVLADFSTSDIKDLYKAMADIANYPDSAPVALDGAALFVTNCGSCHTGNGLGSGASDKTGRTADEITAAIANVGAMSGLSSLTSEEIQAIADALVPVP